MTNRTGRILIAAVLACGSVLAPLARAEDVPALFISNEIEEKTIAERQSDLANGAVTSEQLVEAYLALIEKIDRAGPTLRSIMSLNPNAREDARKLDAERRAGKLRGPLHGIPILLKDNIESVELPTTAGSLALAANMTNRDAPFVARLRAAGAIVLGKTNLSEWANIRSSQSISGWSAAGGLTRNPYALDRSACGSSSGSGAGGMTGTTCAASAAAR